MAGILGDAPDSMDATDAARSKATQSLEDAGPRIPGTDFPLDAGEGAVGSKTIPAEADVLAGKAGNGIKAFLTGDGELITVKNGQAVATKAPKLAQLLDEAHDAMTATKGFANKYLAKGAEEVAQMGTKGGILDAAGGVAGDALAAGARGLLGVPALAALIGFSPTEANAGEDKIMDQRNSGALKDQSAAAMGQAPAADKGVNPAEQPTKTTAKDDGTPKTDIGKAMPKAATMKDDVTGKKQGGVDTKGGFFPQYDKGSAEAGDFRQAFANAVKSGAATFNWQGRQYSTQMAK